MPGPAPRCNRCKTARHPPVRVSNGGEPVRFCVKCAGELLDELGCKYLHAATGLHELASILLQLARGGAERGNMAETLKVFSEALARGLEEGLDFPPKDEQH